MQWRSWLHLLGCFRCQHLWTMVPGQPYQLRIPYLTSASSTIWSQTNLLTSLRTKLPLITKCIARCPWCNEDPPCLASSWKPPLHARVPRICACRCTVPSSTGAVSISAYDGASCCWITDVVRGMRIASEACRWLPRQERRQRGRQRRWEDGWGEQSNDRDAITHFP